jgi:hypothetical protein
LLSSFHSWAQVVRRSWPVLWLLGGTSPLTFCSAFRLALTLYQSRAGGLQSRPGHRHFGFARAVVAASAAGASATNPTIAPSGPIQRIDLVVITLSLPRRCALTAPWERNFSLPLSTSTTGTAVRSS